MRPPILYFFVFLFVFCLTVEAQTQDELFAQATLAFEAVKAGDVTKLPELEKMLADPRLNTVARTTLENLPNRVGLETLRKGLAAADEHCVAGVIASLGSMRDFDSLRQIADFASCDCHGDLVRTVALKTLGKLTENEDAVAVLRGALFDKNPAIQRAAADGFFTAANEIRVQDPKKAAAWFREVREAKIDGPTTRIVAQNEILLTGDEGLFLSLLTSADDADFRSAQIVLAKATQPEISATALKTLATLNAKNQSKTLATLGISGNQALTPFLLGLTANEKIALPAVLEALGNLRDARALDVLLARVNSENEEVQNAAIAAICKLKAEEVGPKLAVLPYSPAVTRIVGTMKLAEMTPKLLAWAETDARTLVVYSQIVASTPAEVEAFVNRFAENAKIPVETFETALQTLCRRTSDKKATIDFLTRKFADAPVLAVRYVGAVGGKDAAEFLGSMALQFAPQIPANATGQETAALVVDEATKVLGKWANADAGAVLSRLAVLLPEGKFRTRALRGFLRILRQMGMTPLEKRQMLNTALVLTEGNQADRDRFGFLVERFNQEFPETQLFNGKDLTGWEKIADVFTVEDGAIVGGNFETGVDRNQFLTTKDSYGDFYFRVECKIIDGPENAKKDGNAGIQFHSVRVPNNHEMVGYQADMTSNGGYWGHLYDESRRNRMLQTPPAELVKALWKPNDWNRYEILCQGKNIRLFLNGVETVNYTEEDDSIPQTGLIGLQIHAGGPARSYYRNVFISTAATSDSRW